MDVYGISTYDLLELQQLLRDGECIITSEARRRAVSVGYVSEEEMVGRVLRLRPDEIYKTMTATKCPGLWQDVYKTQDDEFFLYIKLQKAVDGRGIIIQFKEDTGER